MSIGSSAPSDCESDPAVLLAREVSSVLSAADIDNKVVLVRDRGSTEHTLLLPSTYSFGCDPMHHYVQVGTYTLHEERILHALEGFYVKKSKEKHHHPALGSPQQVYDVSAVVSVKETPVMKGDLGPAIAHLIHEIGELFEWRVPQWQIKASGVPGPCKRAVHIRSLIASVRVLRAEVKTRKLMKWHGA